MSDSPATITVPIDYQLQGSTDHNAVLKGSGELTIHRVGPRYVFTGHRRATLSASPMEIAFEADAIWNVVVRDRAVAFTTRHPDALPHTKPFVFFCADSAQALAVASLLPRHVDADFTAERDFITRLHTWQPPRSPIATVTNGIIALNVVAFVIMGSLGAGWVSVESMQPYILYGANNGAATTDGEWWRLLTSMFIHYGLLHLALNMWALYQAGQFLEKLQGRALYALTYLGAGLAGGFASLAWHGDKTWSAGASGAVFGVFGAMIGYMLREKRTIPRTIFTAMMKSSLAFTGFNVFFGLTQPGIDNAAHLGGLAGGLVLGFLVALPLDQAVRAAKTKSRMILGAFTIAVLVATGVALTPRYDYSVKDELALNAANLPFETRESELGAYHDAALQRIRSAEDAAAHAEWLEQTMIPFYRDWVAQLTTLPLKENRVSYQRRALAVRYYTLLTTSLTHLAANLRAHKPDAIAIYQRELALAAQAIHRPALTR